MICPMLEELASYGADARIVSASCWPWRQMAKMFTAGPKFEVSADVAGVVSITAAGDGSVSGSTAIKLGPSTGLGYLLLNFGWNDNKTQIRDPRIDEQGIN